MKILTVVYSLEKGGTQRAAQNFAEGYMLNGHDSRLLVTKYDGMRQAELKSSGVHVWMYINESVLSEMSEWQPECIHIHSHGLDLDEVRAILDCSPTAKVIETNVFSWPSPWVNLIDNSYQLSEWCQWLYQKRSKDNFPSDVVPYPVRTETFSRASDIEVNTFRMKYGVSSDEILIGRIGQSYEAKWSPLLLKTYTRLKKQNSNFKLLLVNPPESIKSMVLRSAFKESIIVIDSILGDKNLAVAYSAIDIFALVADIGESFGMVLAEAMLCETAVVAFSTPWADNSQCEVVGHMQGGIVVTTSKGFNDAILKLANSAEMRKEMGVAGRKKVIHDYDYRKVARLSLERIASHRRPQNIRGVPNIYFDAYDKPNFISLILLRNGFQLKLLRFLSGSLSWDIALKKLVKKLISPLRFLAKKH